MVEAIGHAVINLHRTSFGEISLKGVKEGDWVELTEKEMSYLLKAIEQSDKNNSNKSRYEDILE